MVRNSLRLPKSRFRDATHTTMLQNTYYKRLIGLFNKFQEKLQPHMTTILKQYELSNDYQIKPGAVKIFNDKIDSVGNATIYAGVPGITYDNLKQAYMRGKTSAANNPRIKGNSIIIPYQMNLLDQRVVDDLKTRNVGLVTKLTEEMKSGLLQTLTDGIQQQQSTEDIIKAINQQIPDITRSRAMTIARTEISNSYNNAVSQSYQSLGIEKWQWLSAMGDTVCEECARRHGDVYDWSDEQPPLHPNCFCTIYPIVDRPFGKPEEEPEGEPAEIEPRQDINPHKPIYEPYKPIKPIEEKINENLYEYEDTIRGNTDINLGKENSFETVQFIDSETGEVVMTRRGYTLPNGQKVVSLSDPKNPREYDPRILKYKEKGTLIMTHNHPSNSAFSFEDGDYQRAEELNLKETRAVGLLSKPGHITEQKIDYSMKRPDEGWTSMEYLIHDYNVLDMKLQREFWSKIEAGTLEPKEAQLLHNHTIFEELMKKYPGKLIYERKIYK